MARPTIDPAGSNRRRRGAGAAGELAVGNVRVTLPEELHDLVRDAVAELESATGGLDRGARRTPPTSSPARAPQSPPGRPSSGCPTRPRRRRGGPSPLSIPAPPPPAPAAFADRPPGARPPPPGGAPSWPAWRWRPPSPPYHSRRGPAGSRWPAGAPRPSTPPASRGCCAWRCRRSPVAPARSRPRLAARAMGRRSPVASAASAPATWPLARGAAVTGTGAGGAGRGRRARRDRPPRRGAAPLRRAQAAPTEESRPAWRAAAGHASNLLIAAALSLVGIFCCIVVGLVVTGHHLEEVVTGKHAADHPDRFTGGDRAAPREPAPGRQHPGVPRSQRHQADHRPPHRLAQPRPERRRPGADQGGLQRPARFRGP